MYYFILGSKLLYRNSEHLKQVYACLLMTVLAAAAGTCFHLFTDILCENVLPLIAGFEFLQILLKNPDESEKNVKPRIRQLIGFVFCTGTYLY